MSRCLQLAAHGLGSVSPNPLVGSVIVVDGEIIGEGFHQFFGGPHAEVNAIQSVVDKNKLRQASLYVNLEPCSHHGKTPPCTDLIISSGIPEVIIGMIDPFVKVAGNGIKKLQQAGVRVVTDVLKEESLVLNKRFLVYNQLKRPYIILKWAETKDGFMDQLRAAGEVAHINWITEEKLKMLVHKWRSEEDAVMVGTSTARNDNPQLTVREWVGRNPIRIVLDEQQNLPESLFILDQTARSLVITSKSVPNKTNLEYIHLDFSSDIIPSLLHALYTRGIQSVLVEGGKELLESFIKPSLWDEARLFTGNRVFRDGLRAPVLTGELLQTLYFEKDKLEVYRNPFQAMKP